MAHKTLLSWSSGKDSAWTLWRLRNDPRYEVAGLLTTINQAFDRVAMHAVRSELLQRQADAAGLPLTRVEIPWPCSNAQYEAAMGAACASAVATGITHIAFGDLFLEDVRQYRIDKLAGTGLTPVFPLWQIPTAQLAREMIASGLKARITCVDPKQLPESFIGRDFDEALLGALPATADPCGEKGEFHSFCYAGPMFEKPIAIASGEVVTRDGFVFGDLLPA